MEYENLPEKKKKAVLYYVYALKTVKAPQVREKMRFMLNNILQGSTEPDDYLTYAKTVFNTCGISFEDGVKKLVDANIEDAMNQLKNEPLKKQVCRVKRGGAFNAKKPFGLDY